MNILSVDEFRRRARRRLPRAVFDYLEGGADSERGLRRNREAFERIAFRPRRLIDVSTLDTSVRLFGKLLKLPFIVAPTGLNGAFWPNGDIALARAAERAGIPFVLSTASTSAIEAVSRSAGGELWFQLYVVHRDIAREMAMRAWNAGFATMVLTTDVAVNGRRLRDLRSGFKVPFRPGLRLIADLLSHPRWLADQLRHGFPDLANFSSSEANNLEAQSALMARKMDASFSWDDLKNLRDLWPGKLLVKGIIRKDDAQRCVELGIDGVILSNHGGRQLDDIASPMTLLAEDDWDIGVPILIDSGVREAADGVKAIAFGARSVLLGRALLYGLAVAGDAGVSEIISMFKADLERTMALVGASSLAELDRHFVAA